MEGALTYLQKRLGDDWLIGHDSGKFNQLSEQLFLQFTQQTNRETRLKILIAESDPVSFLASFIAACAANCDIFLCNPNWVEQEWQQVFNLVQPDLILGQQPQVKSPIAPNPQRGPRVPHSPFPATNRIMIPTGGSSGKIRFAIHTWETLIASVAGFSQYFEKKQINSFCVLPLYHVSGLMQFMRSFTTGGSMVILPFKDMISGAGKDIDLQSFLISLVPTQLARLLTHDWAEYLSKFQTILLGGAPAWGELLEQARLYKIPLAPTYGMTETASQVVTLKPEAFLAGNNSCGQILPHAQVTIRSLSGEILGTNQTGIVTIQADSLALGYYLPEESLNLPFTIANLKTDDLGFLDDQGYLNIVGRSSNKIITGGENVFPAEVEAAIQATQLVTDVCVTGLPDSHWGQIVTAVYVASSQAVSTTILQKAVEDKLTKYKRPKHWVPLESLPRNLQGKVNYEEIRKAALASRNEVLKHTRLLTEVGNREQETGNSG